MRERRGWMVEFRACQHGQKTNAVVVVVVFRLFQASFIWRPGWFRSWLLETRGDKEGARGAFEGKDMGLHS